MGSSGYEPFLQAYDVNISAGTTVLDALHKIKDEQDGTLSFRRSCRSAICGSCAVKINGTPKLACKTQVIPEFEKHSTVIIESLSSLPVIKDLVVDFDAFWHKIHKIEPYLNPKEDDKDLKDKDGWWIIKKEDALKTDDASNCIACGCCYSSCNTMDADREFLGPAALTKAWRFIGDIREGKTRRLSKISDEHGIWSCSRCIECTEVCPKDVRPLTAIENLRSEAIKKGITDNAGVRHVEAMVDSVRKTGKLDEAAMTFRTLGFMRSIGMIPLGLKMELHGKMPLPSLFGTIEGIDEVKKIYDEIEKENLSLHAINREREEK